jgi:hypothetical protein
MMPNYTIFLPLYNSDKHFDNICSNIKKQKKKADQVIVIDDTKNSAYFINKLNDFLKCKNITNEFSIIKNKKNLKPSMSWNLNLKLFRNKLVFRMDADDTWNEFHTTLMIKQYMDDKSHSVYVQKNKASLFQKLYYNYDFIFTNQAIHSSALFNLNHGKIIYPGCQYAFDDLRMFIKYKYIKKKSIKFVDINTCELNLNFKHRWSNIVDRKLQRLALRKYFFLALKKKLLLKKISKFNVLKIFVNLSLFQSIFIIYKILK